MKRRSLWIFGSVPPLLSPHLPQSVFHNEHVQRAQTRFLSYEGVYRAFVREAFSVTFNSADGLLRSFDSTKHPRFRNAFETAAFRLARQRIRLDEILREHSWIRICLCHNYNLFLNYSMIKVVLNWPIKIFMQFSIRIQWL